MSDRHLDTLIALALEEDVGPGDVTSEAVISPEAQGRAVILAKEDLVLSGVLAALRVFERVDSGLAVVSRPDGSACAAGEEVMEVTGGLRGLLTAERTALNFLQRLSGIATLTRRYTEALAGTQTRLLDTRKTTPGWRLLEKAAVRHGGGHNHRMALFDGILIKDNHVRAAGGISAAVARARSAGHPLLKIEVEVEDLAGLEEALEAGADMILLDNMDDEALAEAVRIAAGRVPLEASGGITLERLPRIGATGVDFVSSGALTHSARAVDLSLELG